jgi:molecular chaperone GrpE
VSNKNKPADQDKDQEFEQLAKELGSAAAEAEDLLKEQQAKHQVHEQPTQAHELDQLARELDQLRGHNDELRQDLQRVQADFVNYRRRNDEQRGSLMDAAKRDVVLEILPLLDNIDRALGHLPHDLERHAWAQGVEQVAKQASDTLKNMGVTRMTTIGQLFDPKLHEAVSVEEGQGPDEVIIEELQPGYTINGEVLKHAMVKVGRR